MRSLSIMLMLLGLTLSACGSKGPLYLPDENKTQERENKG
jgi:predicted small lipoprotein YifL